MRRHLTLSTMLRHAGSEGDRAATAPEEAHAEGWNDGLSTLVQSRPQLTLAGPPVWRHTLILTGRLDHRSAPDLEDEIECLDQEGVVSLTLDLRRLEAIDSTGLAVIAWHSQGCQRRGHDFAVIPGSLFIHRALAEAGVTELVMPEASETVVGPGPGGSVDDHYSDRSTAMVRAL
jgi:anti-anti-sigma factor